MKLLIPFFIFLLSSIALHSQKFELKDLPQIDLYDHYLVSGNNNDYFDISTDFNSRGKVKETFITRFDRALNKTYSHSLGDLLQGAKFRGAMATGGQLVLFGRDEGEMKRFIIETATGKAVDAGVSLYTLPTDVFDHFHSGFSPDGSKFFAVSRMITRKGTNFKVAVFDKGCRLLYQFSVSAGEKGDMLRELQFLLSDKAEFTLVYALGKENKHDVYTATAYEWIRVNEKGIVGESSALPLQQNDMGQVIFKLAGDTLRFTGMVSHNKKMFTSNITGAFHIPTRKMVYLNETPFSEIPFFKSADRPYIKDRSLGGIWKGFELVKQYQEDDGGTLSLWESRSKEVVQRSSYSVVFHRTGSVLVMKRSKDQQIQWFRMIVKAQEESDFDYFTSTVAMRDKDGGLTLFFHDNPSNAAPELGTQATHGSMLSAIQHQGLAAVYIDKSGNATKQWVLHNSSRTTHLSPLSSGSFYTGEVIYKAIRNRKIGKEECQIGMLTISK